MNQWFLGILGLVVYMIGFALYAIVYGPDPLSPWPKGDRARSEKSHRGTQCIQQRPCKPLITIYTFYGLHCKALNLAHTQQLFTIQSLNY